MFEETLETPGRTPEEKACIRAVIQLDLRVGTVVNCCAHPSDSKFFCAEVDVGAQTLNVALQVRKYYDTPALVQGKTVLVLVNLPTRFIHGFSSTGQVLCASTPDHSRRVLLEVPAGANNGDRVRFGDLPMAEAAEPATARGLMIQVLAFLKTNASGVATVLGEHVFTLDHGVVTAGHVPAGSPIG